MRAWAGSRDLQATVPTFLSHMSGVISQAAAGIIVLQASLQAYAGTRLRLKA